MSSSSLGKRKEREGEGAIPGSTLFVSNLPYNVTSVDLQTLFSDIAPIRSAFVVLEQGTGASKGVGYVSFALKEDAHAAVEKIAKEGIQISGRNLRVQFADSKQKGNSNHEKQPRSEPHPRRETVQDPLAIRTIIVSGLPTLTDVKTLWKKFRKYGAEKVEWPVTINETEDPTQAQVIFASPALASKAVEKLHAHVFKGALLSAALKKRVDSLSTKAKLSTKASNPSRGNRLIVRNIPFDITEQDLRAIFLPYGPIHSVVIPSFKSSDPESGNEKELRKGFAFVWMLSKKDAEAALEGCNGMVVRPGIAEDLKLDKQKKKKQRRLDKKIEAEKEGDTAAKAHKAERTIAVDWALSKDRWEEENTKLVDPDAAESVQSEEEASAEDEPDGDQSDSDSDASSSEQDSEHASQPSDSEESETDRTRPQLPDTDVGTTLFVRNIPFEATEEELRSLFRAFGPLRYARITLDPSTGRSRGTGFVCFWNKDDADVVIKQSDLLRTETGSNAVELTSKRNPFTLPSILTPDPSSTLARSLVLHGRTLDAVRAVTREVAGKLKEEGEKRRQKADKRNMYLLHEGVILATTPGSESLPQADLERRTASFNSRKALLKSNPSLYISKTRLSIRQIPTFVTDRMLKRLAIHSVTAFTTEVANGSRTPLTPDEMEHDTPESHSRSGRVTVKQTKIVRQQDRVDPIIGKGRSKGYGFVEVERHDHALQVLRWANNNPAVGQLFESWWADELASLIKAEEAKTAKDEARIKRIREEISSGNPKRSKGTLIVEFSLENVQVVQRRKTLQKESPASRGAAKKRAADEESGQPSPKRQKTAVEVQIEPSGSPKLGSKIGSLIGRKRKLRKAKK